MSEVPLTLNDLKAEFGKDMLLMTLDAYDVSNEDSRPAVIKAPKSDLIEEAEKWRDANPEAAKAVGTVAHRTLVRLPGDAGSSLTSIRNYMAKDLKIERDAIGRRGRYLVGVLDILMDQAPEDTERCLKAIVAFGNGE